MHKLIRQLKALADETRFKIVNLLLDHDFCVSALAKHLGISEAAVSQHLRTLREVGLVKGEKRGYWTHYSVEKDVLKQIASDLQHILSEPVYRASRCDDGSGIEGNCCRREGGTEDVRMLQVSASRKAQKQARELQSGTD